jgi:A/G-specific adenine glycosylase
VTLDSRLRRRFRANLLRWYDREQRKLPWRGETDPYRILVSEIMLQQTRVAVVEDRYKRFLQQFPSAQALAAGGEDSVLAAWSGLGYYRRARNLHAAVKQLTANGGFPRTAADLAQLPGIGRYTAAAVASIAFGEPVAVVDGNVKRVLQRVTGEEISDPMCWATAQEMLEPNRPGDFNQAMMELGATVCLPGRPLCLQCPVMKLCALRGAGTRKQRTARRKAVLSYLLAQKPGQVFLQQRDADVSLMPGMWELPLLGHQVQSGKPLLTLRHSITVTDYTVTVHSGACRKIKEGRWISLHSVNDLPLTGLTRKILHRLQLLPG